MTLAFARVGNPQGYVKDSQRMTVTDVTLDSSYASGGEAVTPSDLGLNRVEYATVTVKSVTGTRNITGASYDPSTSLLHCFDETPAEVTATNSLNNVVVTVRAYGS